MIRTTLTLISGALAVLGGVFLLTGFGLAVQEHGAEERKKEVAAEDRMRAMGCRTILKRLSQHQILYEGDYCYEIEANKYELFRPAKETQVTTTGPSLYMAALQNGRNIDETTLLPGACPYTFKDGWSVMGIMSPTKAIVRIRIGLPPLPYTPTRPC